MNYSWTNVTIDTTHFHHNRDDSCEIDQELRLWPESRMRLRMLRIDDAKNVLSWFTHTRLYIESTFVDLHLRGSNRMIHGNNLIYGERNTEVRVSGCNFSTTVSLVSSLRLRYNKHFRRKDTCGQKDVYYENVSSRMMLYSTNFSSGCQK